MITSKWAYRCLTVGLVFCPIFLPAAESYKELSPARIAEITGMLPETPMGFGKPARDRAAWDDSKIRAAFVAPETMARAEKLLSEPFPAWDDAAYLEYSRIGTRPRGEAMLRERGKFLRPLVLAECFENKGRFIPKLTEVLNGYVADPTWTLPAHDAHLDSYQKKTYTVDLRAAGFGGELAQTLYLLGEKIPNATRQQVLAALEQRVFAPVLKSFRDGTGHFWLTAQMNWNPVCLSGVTNAALAVLPARDQRAVFVAGAEHYGGNYLKGIGKDGYCTEGAGYWSYGFGAFITLREGVLESTKGRIDLFSDPKTANAALFGARVQMVDGLAPPFADCRAGVRLDLRIVHFCEHALHLTNSAAAKPESIRDGLTEGCMDAFLPRTEPAMAAANTPNSATDLRWFFKDAGVLVARPALSSTSHLAVAIKAAGNGAHSHNDIGSYVIALGKDLLAGDPGGPYAYTNETFGPKRYTKFKMFSSFGHPLPVIGGELQIEAATARPKVLSTTFTDSVDTMSIDIASAYQFPKLQKLVRTLRYERQGAGAVTVEDEFAFSEPSSFEVGLPTRAKWTQKNANTLELVLGAPTLLAEVQAPVAFDVTAEIVSEQSAPPFTRLGIRLKQPVKCGVVRVTFRPSPEQIAPGTPLKSSVVSR